MKFYPYTQKNMVNYCYILPVNKASVTCAHHKSIYDKEKEKPKKIWYSKTNVLEQVLSLEHYRNREHVAIQNTTLVGDALISVGFKQR